MKLAPLVIMLLSLLATTANAQERDPAAAEALFNSAYEDKDRGDFASACPKFRESNRLDPAVGTVLNIADCSEKLGLLAEAWQRYREAADKLDGDDPRRDLAVERATALEPRLPKLTITTAPLPEGARIERDGVAIGTASLGVATPVDPGSHTVVVRAPGFRDRSYTVSLIESEKKELVVDVGEPLPEVAAPTPVPPAVAAPDPPAPRPVPPPEPDTTVRTAGWVTFSLGVGVFLAGVAMGVITLNAQTTLLSHCDERTKACDEKGVDAAEEGKTFGPLATVGLSLGAAGMIADAVLLGVGYGDSDPADVTWRVGPGGLSIAGSF